MYLIILIINEIKNIFFLIILKMEYIHFRMNVRAIYCSHKICKSRLLFYVYL